MADTCNTSVRASDTMSPATETITGLVLAGGLGRRMGGVDKGLQLFRGIPLASHVINRLAPQVDTLLINANQNTGRYEALGYPVVSDLVAGYAGPLAGLHAGLARCTTPLLISCPCDSPFLPMDLATRLRAGLSRAEADVAYAVVDNRAQPVFSLVRRDVLPALARFLDEGGRKVGQWHASIRAVGIPFDDEAAAFANINTVEELAAHSSHPDSHD